MRLFRTPYALIALCFCLLFIPVIAQETPPETGVLFSSDAVTDGYVLFSPIASPVAYLIDNEGRIVNQWRSQWAILASYLLENGDLLVAVQPGDDFGFPVGQTGRIERYSWDGELLWFYELATENMKLHHDIELMPDGHILASMWERVRPAQFAEYGISQDNIPPDNQDLFYGSVIEIDPESNEIVWQWRLLDHSIQQVNDTLPNYGIPSENPHLIDLNFAPRPGELDRSHVNGISYHPELNQIMISAHYYSEIWIISRDTGELVYRWGNPATYGHRTDDNHRLHLQHNPTWLDNGNIMIFNNGNQASRPYSDVLEITPPLNVDGSYDLLDGMPYDPSEAQLVYRADPPESFFAINTSGAQRLPNGHTFITDGPHGRLFEIDVEGQIVWEYQSPVWIGQEPFVPLIFRANRYLPDYPAFTGRDLTPGGEIPYRTSAQ